VEFRGLTCRATHWTLPPQGYDDTQAAVAAGAMIEATGACDCTWDRCEMTQTDAYAAWLRSGCRRSTLRQCHLHDLGAGGVKLGEAQREDPRFIDAARRDFRLRPDSPALALGFQAIDMEAIGLSGPAAWRSLPSRARRPIPREDVPQSHSARQE
jgi:hypothetical protein